MRETPCDPETQPRISTLIQQHLLAYKGKDYKAQAIQGFWIYDGNELKLARH